MHFFAVFAKICVFLWLCYNIFLVCCFLLCAEFHTLWSGVLEKILCTMPTFFFSIQQTPICYRFQRVHMVQVATCGYSWSKWFAMTHVHSCSCSHVPTCSHAHTQTSTRCLTLHAHPASTRCTACTQAPHTRTQTPSWMFVAICYGANNPRVGDACLCTNSLCPAITHTKEHKQMHIWNACFMFC